MYENQRFFTCKYCTHFETYTLQLLIFQQRYSQISLCIFLLPPAPRDTHIVQNLTFSLGVMEHTHAQHVSMATVCRITRNMVFPPQFRTIQEWFHYAFCTSELDSKSDICLLHHVNGYTVVLCYFLPVVLMPASNDQVFLIGALLTGCLETHDR